MTRKIATSTVRQFLYWALVCAYIVILPETIVIYKKISANFAPGLVGKIPVVVTLSFLILYIAKAYTAKKPMRSSLVLMACVLIYFYAVYLVPYPNKHIHIPEYILLSWLVYIAISPSYSGKGILLLVFIISSFLGCIDEIIQGLHPERFYGLKDMVINSLSALIGILSIYGIRDISRGTWKWVKIIKRKPFFLFVFLFTFAGATLVIFYLFRLKLSGSDSHSYPNWLILQNLLSLLLCFATLTLEIIRKRKYFLLTGKSPPAEEDPNDLNTVFTWICCLLVPLAVIHALAPVAILTHCPFK